MYKNSETGYWEHDFRRERVAPRLHLSYGTTKKDEATPLHATMLRLFKEKHVAVIEEIRAGRRTVQEVTRLLAEGKPLTAVDPVGAWPSVRVAVVDYLAWLTDNPKRQQGTTDAATWQLKRFVTFLGDDADQPLDAVTTKRVTEYQASLMASGAAVNTMTASVSRVGSLYRWHRDTELRDAQETKRPPKLLHIPIDPDTVSTERTHRTRFLLEREAGQLLAACPRRLLCPVAIGLLAGLRIDEVLHLRPVFDVDLDLGLLTVQVQPGWRPKSGKRRDVPIAAALRPLIESHLAEYASEDWLVPMPSNHTRAYNLKVFDRHFRLVVGDAELIQGRKDPKGVVFHTLRHTFASWLAMRGVDLYTIAKLLGNSLAMVESTYGHLAPDFRQRAVDRLAGAVVIPDLSTATENAKTEEPE